jgi:hypothetical protein
MFIIATAVAATVFSPAVFAQLSLIALTPAASVATLLALADAVIE